MNALLDGHSRLDQSLRPSAYRLRLHVDPSAARYEGQVEIECLDMAEREAALGERHARKLAQTQAALDDLAARRAAL
jgi:hypothetical protein